MKIAIKEKDTITVRASIDTRCNGQGWSRDGGIHWNGPEGDGHIPNAALPTAPAGALIGAIACNNPAAKVDWCHGRDYGFGQLDEVWDQVSGAGSRRLLGEECKLDGTDTGFLYLMINAPKATLGNGRGGIWVDVEVKHPASALPGFSDPEEDDNR